MARTTDSELSSLSYWIEDKGIKTAFEDYYPNLALTDPIIRAALVQYNTAILVIQTRAKQITQEAQDAELD